MGYQKEPSSLHASFDIQEAIRHYSEKKSNVTLVSLDSMKAFDTVWHDALLLNLFQHGTTGHLWLLLDEMYSAMQSCVLFNYNYSQWFNRRRGVRQMAFYQLYYIWFI